MELNAHDIELIERSLDGQLNDTEKTVFSQRMASDADFKAEVEAYQEAILAVKLAGEDAIMAVLREEQAKLKGAKVIPIFKKNYKTFSILRGALAAASIAALVFVGNWVWNRPNEPTVQLSPLVMTYFQPYPALGIHRGGETKDVITEALRTYGQNDYKNAIPLLEESFNIKKDSLLLFYKSIAYLGNGQADKAQPILTALQGSDTVPTESVVWYLALAYVELGEKEKAVALLKNIANTEGGNQQKAIDILAKLK